MVDDDNYNLFDDSEFQTRIPPGSTSLVIRAPKGQALSKEQRTFNRLTKRIAELERQVAAEREKLDLLLGRYHAKVAPVEKELARRQVELAQAVSAANDRFAMRKSQKEDLREMLLDLFDEAFRVMKPDAAIEALYDRWSETSYREEIRQEAEIFRRRVAEDLRAEYGIHVDVADDDYSEEATARFLRNAQDKVRTAETEAGQPGRRDRRGKKPKHANAQAQLQERQALTRKSVRDIYLSLAKVLHPDTVADPAERAVREEYMKQATFAYRQGDIAALLKLELRWVVRDHTGPDALTGETLRAYIPALQEQLTALERALGAQMLDPRYAAITPVASMAERPALLHLNERAQALREHAAATVRQLEFVTGCTSKTAFTTFLRDYTRARAAEEDLYDMLSAVRDADEWR